MEAPLKDCTTLEQRAVIRFLNAEGIQTSQICQRMKIIYGESCLSQKNIYKWVNEFKNGRITCSDIERPGRPSVTATPSTINANISFKTVHTIINEQLQFRKICCRWIPHFLNLDQKLNRIRVSKALLKRYEEEGDHFLDQIVTGDESWCYHYDPSTKKCIYGMETRRLSKTKKKKKKKKQVSTFGRRSMNSDLYCDILVNKLKPGIRNKRRGKLSEGVLFLHDNARPHTSCKTVSTIIKLGFEVLEHPAYSPDLAPSDYLFFGLLKKELKGKRFDSDEDVQKVVQNFFHTLPKSAYKEGIYKLPERWRRCIESQVSDFLALDHRIVPTQQLRDLAIIGGCRFLRPPDLLAAARWMGARIDGPVSQLTRPTRGALADAPALANFCNRLIEKNLLGSHRADNLGEAVLLR
ncbi:hypothetical protein LAZ67_2005198 [Cordylochernes scorpioides]|uniref:Transposase n=1 Tax=Cordylochernes scorpioides TaxID=51811 RepID=A0ABY6K464_9ARAC|nr:hypothetical protein LAZ67_2005198 [Cordylochernes scorpioides]